MQKVSESIDRTRFEVFPADLRNLVGEQMLLNLALDAVQSANLTEASAAGAPPRFRPQMLLTLATYCYASGICSSNDVVDAVLTDPTVRYICARAQPDENAVRQFRRQYGWLIERCLASVMRKAWLLQADEVALGPGYDPNLPRKVASAAQARVQASIILDRNEDQEE